MWVRIPHPETLRVPPHGSSAEGESGPKARAKAVVDGQRVKNPVPLVSRKEGRRRCEPARSWLLVQPFEVSRNGENILSQGGSPTLYGVEVESIKLPRKALNPLTD